MPKTSFVVEWIVHMNMNTMDTKQRKQSITDELNVFFSLLSYASTNKFDLFGLKQKSVDSGFLKKKTC